MFLVHCFEWNGSTLDDIGERLEHAPEKSQKRLS